MSSRNPAADPFTPGSGYPPPYLAGREAEREAITELAMPRLVAGRPTRPLLFTGIRGIGKTALLTVARREAGAAELPVVRLEATKRSAMIDALVFQLEEVLTRFSSKLSTTRRALEDLAEFKVGVQVAGSGVEISTRRRSTNEQASTERLFRALLTSAAAAAAAEAKPLVVVIDELQQGPPGLIGPLLTAVHEANQDEIPIGLIAAGLPNTEDWVAQHVTYGGRMFEHFDVALLSRDLAASAYTETLALVPDETVTPDALDELVTLGQGLPYFIQEFGSALWRTADDDPMSLHDVQRAATDGWDAIHGFYRQRWNEASSKEKDYLSALARLDAEPHRSAEIADEMGKSVAAVATYRARLIRDKGLLVEPARGQVQWSLLGFRDWLRAALEDGEANR